MAKLKLGGGNGGHNGLKDIQNKLGNNPNFTAYASVLVILVIKAKSLALFWVNPASEQTLIDDAIDESIRCTEVLLNEGMTKAMNRLHAFKASA